MDHRGCRSGRQKGTSYYMLIALGSKLTSKPFYVMSHLFQTVCRCINL
jgi:hypothetical protein